MKFSQDVNWGEMAIPPNHVSDIVKKSSLGEFECQNFFLSAKEKSCTFANSFLSRMPPSVPNYHCSHTIHGPLQGSDKTNTMKNYFLYE